jgi:hypothetical protein
MILAVLLDAITLYKILMNLFNYILDNNAFFYAGFSATVGFIGYKFVSSYLNSFYYVDKGVQTEA